MGDGALESNVNYFSDFSRRLRDDESLRPLEEVVEETVGSRTLWVEPHEPCVGAGLDEPCCSSQGIMCCKTSPYNATGSDAKAAECPQSHPFFETVVALEDAQSTSTTGGINLYV